MKKIFFFALASLALASCSQDDEIVAENGSKANAGNGSISFNTYIAGQTRAIDGIVTSKEVKTSGFMVNATFNSKVYIANDEAVFEQGTADGTLAAKTNVFDTKDNTYYWPITIGADKPMMFYAFNKIDGAEFVTDGTPAVVTTTTANQLTYTVADNVKDQKDLVVASAKAVAQPTDGEQALNFTHALSMINFSIKAGNTNTKYTYVIKRIEVLANSGLATCTIAKTSELADSGVDKDQPGTNAQSTVASWGVPASKVTGDLWTKATGLTAGQKTDAATAANGTLYEYYNDATSTAADTNKVSGTTELKFKNNMMLYPNAKDATDNKIAIRVYYKVIDNQSGATLEDCEVLGDCGYTNIGCKTVVIDDAKWEAGKAYRYVLTLPMTNFIGDTDADGVPDDQDLEAATPNKDVDGDGDENDSEFAKSLPIRFTVTVSNWVDVTANDITIK